MTAATHVPPEGPACDTRHARADVRCTVLDVTEWFGETSGGVQTYLLQKSAYVRRRGDLRQVIVVPGERDEVRDDVRVRTYRLRGPRIPLQPQYRFFLATRSLRRIIATERPDVIEVGSQMLVPWVVRLATRRSATPLVGFFHADIEGLLAGDGTHPAARLSAALARRYVRGIDTLFAARIAASDVMAASLARAGVSSVSRIPLGVDLDVFHPGRRRHARAARALLGLPTDAPLAVYLGRLAPEKELDVLLDAWEQVEARTDGAWLALMGDGPLAARLRARTQGRRVAWLPFEADRGSVADLLAAADISISPGGVETFGLAALEAMACGTPVLSADAGAVAELLHRAEAGATFTRGSPAALADAATMLLDGSTDLAAMGRRGRAYAEREHGWDRVFDQLFALYDGVRRSRP